MNENDLSGQSHTKRTLSKHCNVTYECFVFVDPHVTDVTQQSDSICPLWKEAQVRGREVIPGFTVNLSKAVERREVMSGSNRAGFALGLLFSPGPLNSLNQSLLGTLEASDTTPAEIMRSRAESGQLIPFIKCLRENVISRSDGDLALRKYGQKDESLALYN
ncbi:hypothetical protein STEG23_015517 [Scotinomys teguina]